MENLEGFRELTKYHDKPISTITLYLQSLIYKNMKKDNIKICLSGNGSDELFAATTITIIYIIIRLKIKPLKKVF